jgi:hypothetical protein
VLEELHSYFRTRDVTQNEVLIFRESEDSVYIYYTPEAEEDCKYGNVRGSIRSLVSEYTVNWECNDRGIPVYAPKHLARSIIRMLKVTHKNRHR